MNTNHIVQSGTKWSIGNGQGIDLWNDWWCGEGPLAKKFPGNHVNTGSKVSDIMGDNQTWFLDNISHIIDRDTSELINNIYLVGFTSESDQPCWTHAGNGIFSASSAYEFICKEGSDLSGWKWLWKLKVPSKLKTFTWLILLNKLPTNELRNHRGLCQSGLCPRCNLEIEDINHLFRGCPKAKDFWSLFRSSQWLSKDLDCPILDWITRNLKSTKISGIGNNIPWSCIFLAIIWQIWKDRNRKSFDNFDIPSTVSFKATISYANEIQEAFKSLLTMRLGKPALTRWFPSPTGLKLNTDGSWYITSQKAGCGGLFRDKDGNWIFGYYGKIIWETSLAAELWAIYRGLTIILEKNMQNVVIESDSLMAVNLINEEFEGSHPQSNMIYETRALKSRTGAILNHISRNANECADHLARLGAEQNEHLVLMDTMPLSLHECWNRDRLGLRKVLD